jgi:hypothetical protein
MNSPKLFIEGAPFESFFSPTETYKGFPKSPSSCPEGNKLHSEEEGSDERKMSEHNSKCKYWSKENKENLIPRRQLILSSKEKTVKAEELLDEITPLKIMLDKNGLENLERKKREDNQQSSSQHGSYYLYSFPEERADRVDRDRIPLNDITCKLYRKRSRVEVYFKFS